MLRIGIAIALLLALVFLLMYQANALMGRGLAAAFGQQQSTFRNAWWTWDGDVVAKELLLTPAAGGASSAVRFAPPLLETPGWFWFWRHLITGSPHDATLRRFHLTLDGARSGAGIDPSMGALGPFGAASASPFEAEGCATDSAWTREAIQEMELRPDPTRLVFERRIDRGRLLESISMETRNVSRVRLQRVGQLPEDVSVLRLQPQASSVVSERWEVQDEGFVRARNRYCAKKDGIDLRRFLERHVESVQRLLDSRGIGVDAATRTAYRRFARDGGRLVLDLEHASPVAGDGRGALLAGADVITASTARLDHNDRLVAIEWQLLAPRPLVPIDGETATTFALLQAERAAAIRGDSVADALGESVLGDETSVVPMTAASLEPVVDTSRVDEVEGDSTLAESTGDPETASSLPGPAAKDEGAAATPGLSAANAAAQTDDAKAEAASAADAAVAPPAPAYASSLPEPGSQANTSRAGRRLQWEDLVQYEGRLIRVWTMHNPPRTVELLSADPRELRVKARMGGGHGEYTVQREGFLRASLIR